MQTCNKITTYPYGTNAFKVIESEMITVKDLFVKNYTDCPFLWWNNIATKIILMINFDDCANENKTKHNPDWPYIPDHPYRTLIIGGSGSGKTNALLIWINKDEF